MHSPVDKLCYWHPLFASQGPQRQISADLCIYGGTAGGVIAAVQAARLGLRTVILEPGPKIGGMTASGLGLTDLGHKAAIGGLAREFYRRVGKEYGVSEAWTFEPHVAYNIFVEWLKEDDIEFYTREFVDSVEKEGKRVTAVRTQAGLVVRASMYIDASYEGDLMAAVGVNYTVGREGNAKYGEKLNGAQIHSKHQFDIAVDPYVVPGDPASGLVFGIEPGQPVVGAEDHRVQAYCFRVCMSDDPVNRVPFSKPADYNPNLYILHQRYLAAGWRDIFTKFDRLRVKSKTDTNNHGATSTDFIGQNYAWPCADYNTRERIFQAHIAYQQGLHWFMANAPVVPQDVRERYASWGLARDEFVETGGWPHQLYVREARRLVSDYIMTEHECRGARVAPNPVALAAYTMDSHNCRRFAVNGRVWNEGDVQEHGFPPYPIDYRAITPRASECENLLVPVCLAASHVAYGSIRMEPVFMVLGQTAATAAAMAISEQCSIQDVPYADLRMALLRGGQILEWKGGEALSIDTVNPHESGS
ncbi:MAG: FAD-dependent oxidoreductase [Nibricoccus sp.]